jgi:signal peptidase I
MGNPDQLSEASPVAGGPRRTASRAAGPVTRSAAKPWRRTVLYGAGTISMLLISMVSSLSLWILLPWAFLDWSPTLVTSGSMQPLVAPGDVVMIRPVAPEELTPNTVVLFERADDVRVLHRIVEQLPDGTFRTQGDANAVPDSEFLHAENIRGAAVLAVPWVGRPSLWLSEGRVLPLATTAVVLIVVLYLAPRSFDPAYDPWSSGLRVNPAEVLLGRSAGNPADRRGGAGRRLLPEKLHGIVLERLAAQSAAAQRRTAHLLEGLS